MLNRDETSADRAAVRRVVAAAFGQPDEAELVGRLHDAGDVVVSLVAELDGAIVGHVLLSRMTAPFPAPALAPVSVTPLHQNRGVGAALVRAALARAAAGEWRGVFVLGDRPTTAASASTWRWRRSSTARSPASTSWRSAGFCRPVVDTSSTPRRSSTELGIRRLPDPRTDSLLL